MNTDLNASQDSSEYLQDRGARKGNARFIRSRRKTLSHGAYVKRKDQKEVKNDDDVISVGQQ